MEVLRAKKSLLLIFLFLIIAGSAILLGYLYSQQKEAAVWPEQQVPGFAEIYSDLYGVGRLTGQGSIGPPIYAESFVNKESPGAALSDSAQPQPLRLAGCQGQYVSATFVVGAREANIQNLLAVPSALSGPGGSIPAEAVDIRVLKWWYQVDKLPTEAGADFLLGNPATRVLAPGLLLHDDDLIRVMGGENYARLQNGEYRWISDSTKMDNTYPGDPVYNPTPSEFPIKDSEHLEQVQVPGGTYKQYWVTVRIPEGTVAGTYRGRIALRSSHGTLDIEIELLVYPFQLEPSMLEYSIYYRGMLLDWRQEGSIGSDYKTEAQLRAEFADMREHGITNPQSQQAYDPSALDEFRRYLQLRLEAGFTDPRYYCEGLFPSGYQDPAQAQALMQEMAQYGYTELYLYAAQEESPEGLLAQKPSLQALKAVGVKIVYAGSDIPELAPILGGIIDLYNNADVPTRQISDKWHALGARVFSYNNPQSGTEYPEVYRRNYGLLLWQAGYDGAMNYAYHTSFGFVWNDFDDPKVWDHNMTYPTVDGVVDTIQWEGWREGIYDTRYLATLLKAIETARAQGRDVTEAQNFVASLQEADLKGIDLNEVRARMASYIMRLLAIQGQPPAASFRAAPDCGEAPLQMQFTDQSSGDIATWEWDFGDGSLSSEQHPAHVYTSQGIYTATLTVIGPGGSSTAKLAINVR